MTPTECSTLLRKHNEWRRGDDEDGPELKMLHPLDVGVAIDTAIQLIEQRDELLTALEGAISIAKVAYEHWDKDRDAKVGKMLSALSGYLPKYNHVTNMIHETLQKAKGGEV
jgi:hypothetical protein